MRAYSTFWNIEGTKALPPDSVQTMLLAAGVHQAMDLPSTLAQVVRFTGMTTGNAQLNFMVALGSTHAIVPTSGSSVTTGTTAGSTANSIPVLGFRELQIPGYTTGWSAAALTSGYVIAEFWRK